MGELITNQDFKTKVTSKVRDVFMDLIPDEELTKLVESEIHAFFHNEEMLEMEFIRERYRSPDTFKVRTTPFRVIVWTEVEKLLRDKLKEIFNQESFASSVGYDEFGIADPASAVLSEHLEQNLEKLVIKMAASMFKGMFAVANEQNKRDTINEIIHMAQNNSLGGNGY